MTAKIKTSYPRPACCAADDCNQGRDCPERPTLGSAVKWFAIAVWLATTAATVGLAAGYWLE